MTLSRPKKVLITGASRGIGAACARAFAEEGAQVALHYRSAKDQAIALLKDLPGERHQLFSADFSEAGAAGNLGRQVLKDFGSLDVLVNNAGIYTEHPIDSCSHENWMSQWQQILQVNLLAIAELTQVISPSMMEQKSGRIINIGSRGAFRGEPESPAYGASKAGLHALSQSLAKKLGNYGIGVYAIAPGFVETDMGRQVLVTERGEALKRESPFRRVAKPEEVAHTALFLSHESSLFLSGGIIDVNGASYLR